MGREDLDGMSDRRTNNTRRKPNTYENTCPKIDTNASGVCKARRMYNDGPCASPLVGERLINVSTRSHNTRKEAKRYDMNLDMSLDVYISEANTNPTHDQ